MGFFKDFRVKARLNTFLKEADEFEFESKWATFKNYIQNAKFLTEQEKIKYIKEGKAKFEAKADEMGIKGFLGDN